MNLRKLVFIAITCLLACGALFSMVRPVSGSYLFSSGWENSGGTDATDGGAWTGLTNTPTVESTIVHSGTYACNFTVSGAIFVNKLFSSSYSTIYVRWYVQISSLPTALNGRIAMLRDTGGSNIYQLLYEYTGSIYRFTLTGSAGSFFYTDTLSLNTWYCLELKLVVSSTVGEIALWINGGNVIDQTGLNTGTTNFQKVYLGQDGQYVANHLYIDDVVIDTSYIGPMSSGWSETFIGIPSSAISSVDGVAKASIANVNGVP